MLENSFKTFADVYGLFGFFLNPPPVNNHYLLQTSDSNSEINL